tara:strand:- start:4211 stop:5053 length:843 start_codon:yes stop_codon:yes gene_type:complete
MNLWRMELIHLFRSWRGWTLSGIYLLASLISLFVGFFIERANGSFPYSQAIDWYITFSIVGMLVFIGIVVSSLAFDGNRDSSIFLRTRFSMKQILLTKATVYFLLSQILFFAGFLIALLGGLILFDTSDHLNFNWVLWGLLLYLISDLFYVALMLFTSSIFRGPVISVLFTLAVILGFPLIGSTLISLELLMRGLIEIPFADWETTSYVAKALLWWPTALEDTQGFLGVTNSEVSSGYISFLGVSYPLDAHFRQDALITTIVSTPILTFLAWLRFSKREI